MERKDLRQHGHGFSMRITQVNGEVQDELIDHPIDIDNISKGGFRFTTTFEFEIEDRVEVILSFPNDAVKNVLGRICYSESVESDDKTITKIAYGFSVLKGFYQLPA